MACLAAFPDLSTMIPPPISAVAAFIEALPPAEQELAYRLRQLILATLPQAEEQFKWKVPFYYAHGPLCYLTPGKGSLILGFYRGAAMADEARLFTAKDRKQIRHYEMHPHRPIPWDDLRTYLIEAWMLNEAAALK